GSRVTARSLVVQPAADELADAQVAEVAAHGGGEGGHGPLGGGAVAGHGGGAAAGRAVGLLAVGDGPFPRSGSDLADRSCTLGSAGAGHGRLRGERGWRHREVLDADAGPFAGAGVDPRAVGERSVGELPGGALHGAELSVDADHADAPVIDRAGPELVAATAHDLRLEPLLSARHQRESIDYLSRDAYAVRLAVTAEIARAQAGQVWCA